MTMRMRMSMRLSLSLSLSFSLSLTIIIKIFFSGQNIKIRYYWFNRQKILQKAKERYSKEKAAEYYLQNKEVIKEKAKNRCKNLSEEEKTKLKSIKRKGIKNRFNIKKKH